MTRDYLLFEVNDTPFAGSQTVYVKEITNNEPVFTTDKKEAMRLDLIKSVMYALKFGLSPIAAD